MNCYRNEPKANGAEVKPTVNGVIISRKSGFIGPINAATNCYASFPARTYSPLVATRCLLNGVSTIEENMFENRFQQAKELRKLGAKIRMEKNIVGVKGVNKLFGTDLYAS